MISAEGNPQQCRVSLSDDPWRRPDRTNASVIVGLERIDDPAIEMQLVGGLLAGSILGVRARPSASPRLCRDRSSLDAGPHHLRPAPNREIQSARAAR